MRGDLKRAWAAIAILAVIAFGVSCAKSTDTSSQENATQVYYEITDENTAQEDSSYIWQTGDGYI